MIVVLPSTSAPYFDSTRCEYELLHYRPSCQVSCISRLSSASPVVIRCQIEKKLATTDTSIFKNIGTSSTFVHVFLQQRIQRQLSVLLESINEDALIFPLAIHYGKKDSMRKRPECFGLRLDYANVYPLLA